MIRKAAAEATRVGDRILLRPRGGARLHLGCGDRRLRRYVNIDLPPQDGVASGQSRPDIEANILQLDCAPGQVSEIRLHHVFEHFERAVALALLVRWHDWLRADGMIVIETPDFDACVADLPGRTMPERLLILRHLFGSQEAAWAQRRDGWSETRFEHVLGELGYREIGFTATQSDSHGLLRNVVVEARRGLLGREVRVKAARTLLRLSMNGAGPTEEQLLGRWIGSFEEALGPQV